MSEKRFCSSCGCGIEGTPERCPVCGGEIVYGEDSIHGDAAKVASPSASTDAQVNENQQGYAGQQAHASQQVQPGSQGYSGQQACPACGSSVEGNLGTCPVCGEMLGTASSSDDSSVRSRNPERQEGGGPYNTNAAPFSSEARNVPNARTSEASGRNINTRPVKINARRQSGAKSPEAQAQSNGAGPQLGSSSSNPLSVTSIKQKLSEKRSYKIGAIAGAALLVVIIVSIIVAYTGDVDLQRRADEGKGAHSVATNGASTDADNIFAVASATSGSVCAGTSSELFLANGSSLLYVTGCTPSDISDAESERVASGNFVSLNYLDGYIYCLQVDDDGFARNVVKIDVSAYVDSKGDGKSGDSKPDGSDNSDGSGDSGNSDSPDNTDNSSAPAIETLYTCDYSRSLTDLYINDDVAYWVERADPACLVMRGTIGDEFQPAKMCERTAVKSWLTVEEGSIFLLWTTDEKWTLESCDSNQGSFAVEMQDDGCMNIGCYHADSVYYLLEGGASLTRKSISGNRQDYEWVTGPTSIAAYGNDVVISAYGNSMYLITLSSDAEETLPSLLGEGADVSSTSVVAGIWRGCPILKSSQGATIYCPSTEDTRSFD